MEGFRAFLDKAMGDDRNNLPEARSNQRLQFSSPEVCKYYLVDFCPHDLFVNTKSHLGECPNIHDEMFRQDYEDHPEKERFGYENDLLRKLESLIAVIERIKREKQEKLNSADVSKLEQLQNRIDTIEEKIISLSLQAEKAGQEGNFDDAQTLLKSISVLEQEKKQLEDEKNAEKQEICDICGATVGIGELNRRTLSHLEGKQHIGYKKIRDSIDSLKQRIKTRTEFPTVGDLSRDRNRDRDRDRHRPRDRSRSQSRERGRRKSPNREIRRNHRSKRSRSPGTYDRQHVKDSSRDRDQGTEVSRKRLQDRSPSPPPKRRTFHN